MVAIIEHWRCSRCNGIEEWAACGVSLSLRTRWRVDVDLRRRDVIAHQSNPVTRIERQMAQLVLDLETKHITMLTNAASENINASCSGKAQTVLSGSFHTSYFIFRLYFLQKHYYCLCIRSTSMIYRHVRIKGRGGMLPIELYNYIYVPHLPLS